MTTTDPTPRPTPQQILALPLEQNDAGAATVRDYLIKLLALVWRDGEGFDGKRPFGNSCWEHDLYQPLVTAGYVAGQFDEWGGLDEVDYDAADSLIAAAIESMRSPA